MEQSKIDSLVKEFQHYDGSLKFIYAASQALSFRKSKQIEDFIKYTFQNNKIDSEIDSKLMVRLSVHWQNVAMSKMEVGDYKFYTYSMFSSMSYRILAHFLDNNSPS